MPARQRPGWVTDAVRIAPVRPAWAAGVRLAIAFVGPLAFGGALDIDGYPVIGAIVALNVGLADTATSSYPTRLRILVAATAVFCGELVLGTVLASSGALLLVATAAIVATAALFGAAGPNGAKLGLLTAIVWTVFAFGSLPQPHAGGRLLAGLAAGTWVVVVELWDWRLRAGRPAPRVVRSLWHDLARLAADAPDPAARTARLRALRREVDVAAGMLSPSEDRALAGEIRAVDALAAAAVTLGRRAEADPAVATWLDDLATLAIGEATGTGRHQAVMAATDDLERRGGARELVDVARAAGGMLATPGPAPAPRRSARRAPIPALVRSVHPTVAQIHQAIRWAVATVGAGAIALWGPFERGYWVPLTVVLVLAPTANATLVRGAQRTVGTVLGLGLGVALVSVVPDGWAWHLALLAAIAVAVGAAMEINYALAVVFITTLIVTVVAWPTWKLEMIADARMVDTLVGAALALAVGLVVWPHHPRDDLRPELVGALTASAAYAAVAIATPGAADRTSDRRRDASRALAEADATIALASSDWGRHPPAQERRVSEALRDINGDLLEIALVAGAGDLAVDAPMEAARREAIGQLTHLAARLGGPAIADGDSVPVPALWPPGARRLGADCQQLRAHALALVGPPAAAHLPR